jgi:predicted TIM-barrel fold metal-dependent hydrolase
MVVDKRGPRKTSKNYIDMRGRSVLMIIDTHVHIWEPDEALVSDFVKKMDEYGIDKACVCPIPPRLSAEFVGKVCRQYPDRLIGFASVLPTYGAYPTGGHTGNLPPGALSTEKLETLVKEYGFRGVKLHPLIQSFIPTDPIVVSVVRKATELGLPVAFHTGPGGSGRIRNGDILYIDDLAIMLPEATLIAVHGGGAVALLGDARFVARKHQNVYLDTAVEWARTCKRMPGLGEEIVGFTGAQKILFGTDAAPRFPERFKDTIDAVDHLNITQKEKNLIFSENAKRILKL